MAYERKDGDVVLFQNKKADSSNKQPTMRGELLLDGITYEVACWTKLDRNGDKFLAGNAKVKGPNVERENASKQEAPLPNDDIPF